MLENATMHVLLFFFSAASHLFNAMDAKDHHVSDSRLPHVCDLHQMEFAFADLEEEFIS